MDLGLGVNLTLVEAGVPLARIGEVKTPGVARPLQEKNILSRDRKLCAASSLDFYHLLERSDKKILPEL